jgi:cytoskeletal protein CcmA (bactofilin family)
MWKKREDEKLPASSGGTESSTMSPATPAIPSPAARTAVSAFGEVAKIGKSVSIKGELSGSEDLYIDGEVQGSIDLQGNGLTLGPNGRVRANIRAKSVVIHGKIDGNVHGSERVELKSSAIVVGDIATKRIAIEEGGFLRGKVELTREETRADAAAHPKPPAASPSSPALSSTAAIAPAAGERKK